MKSFFNLKDKSILKSHVAYEGKCGCGAKYVGETHFSVPIDEHSDTTKVSEPERHLLEFPRHSFTWNIITGQHYWQKRKILEALFIALRNPQLNKKLLAHPSTSTNSTSLSVEWIPHLQFFGHASIIREDRFLRIDIVDFFYVAKEKRVFMHGAYKMCIFGSDKFSSPVLCNVLMALVEFNPYVVFFSL